VVRRNAHTSSRSAGHNLGNSRAVVSAFTTAVGHSVVRSMVTLYAVTVRMLPESLAVRVATTAAVS